MNRQTFFAELRSKATASFGTSISQRQVDGITAILDAGAHLPLPHLAHVLGEVHHETGGGMYPVKETVFRSHKNQNPTDAEVIARLDRAFAKGQLPWVKSPYWRDGFFGRGQIQLTHKANYEKFKPILKVDCVGNPNIVLAPVYSAQVAVIGCERGMFTGHKLGDFDTPTGYDHVQARRIVNGFVTDQALAVAKAARDFEWALADAGYKPSKGGSTPKPTSPAPTTAKPTVSPLAAFLRAVLAFFTKGK